MPGLKPQTVTRFAPSPTGFLHIGGARTALFNHYLALATGGEMRLRIEDTDRERSTDAAKQAILDGLAWLGVEHTGEVVFQSERAERHAEVARELFERGAAYYDTATDAEVEAARESAKAQGQAYRSPHRDRSEAADGAPLRFRVPESAMDGAVVLEDGVAGRVEWAGDAVEDFVLLRADGTPTYMLAVVVDDHDMGVTHVVRGDDHLNNTPKQQLIYQALGWDVPKFAHVPLIHGPDGKKLSKRHGALGVEAYRDMGYLSAAMRNYLVRLGWAHGDQEVFFTDGDIADVFGLEGLNNSPARLDFDKMDYVNQQHIEHTDADVLLGAAEPFLREAKGGALSDTEQARIREALPTLRPRAKTLVEFARVAGYLFDVEPLEGLAGKWAKPLRRDGAGATLRDLTAALEGLSEGEWTSPSLQSALERFVESSGQSFGQVGGPARAALTRGLPSPDLADVMRLLGRDETLARLRDAATKTDETTDETQD